jgi:transmembrane sensor
MSFEPDDIGSQDIVDQAIAWHLRREDMGDADWRAFVLWLEISPAHASAYDAIALQDVAPGKAEPVVAANDNSKRRWWAVGAGLTAAAAMVVGFAIMPRSDPYSIVTQAGEQHEVALSDGTRIELNGATQLTLDRHDLRVATLERGEATFHVRHDAGTPFTLTSGGRTIEDAGTVFNVSRDGERLDVQVAQGAVVFQPSKEALRLTAGNALTVSEGSRTIAISRVAVDTVGGWRHGILSYANVPLSVVRDAVERRYRVQMTVTGDLSTRNFTGMVRLTGNQARDIPHLAALIGADWRNDGTRWILSPTDSIAR